MAEEDQDRPTALPFPPVTAAHILNCSFHTWYPLFRSLTPKSRMIALSRPFLDYLGADGIVLPPETKQPTGEDEADSGFEDGGGDDEADDPSEAWTDIHDQIRATISTLGGKVVPKLNWSAPKDATWIATTNDMECRTPNDVYLLLKSSDFVTHDLEHALEGCTDASGVEIPYHLVLRKAFNLNPSLEFRCFVRNKKLIAVSQREMNYFEFLFDLREPFKRKIQEFLDEKLLAKFPDPNFVFDVYIPPPHERVWLIDINPWAPRTDPLLFSWLELLQQVPEPQEDTIFDPEFRLVKRDDPEAYQFAATKYSAHKLPKEVVDASMGGPGDMKSMMEEWRRVLDRQVEEDEQSEEGAT